MIEDSNPKYYVGIEFKYPLENNEANSEYEKAILEKAKAIVNLQKTERQIISDVDTGFRKISLNRINIAKMERVENLQRGKLFQEEKRFKYNISPGCKNFWLLIPNTRLANKPEIKIYSWESPPLHSY